MINWKLLIILAIVVSVSFIGSLSTSGNTDSQWYLENKPSFTPPNIVFPIIWPALYLQIAMSLYFSWKKAKKKKIIITAYGTNLAANALWSWLFFGIKNPLLAFIDILAILGTAVWMIYISGRLDKKAGWMLVPYLLWTGFAATLNFMFLV